MPKFSGIYKIYFSNCPNCFYIGSAIDLNDRKIRHKYQLNKHTHRNIRMQRICNKYGLQNFVFDIVEIITDKSILIEREQFYINLLKPELNILKKAGSCLGYKHTKNTIEYLSSINKGKVMTPEQNKKNALAQKGNKNALGSKRSESHRSFLRMIKSKKVIDNSTGNIFDSILVASNDTGIKYSTLYAKITGRLHNNTNLTLL